MSTVTSADGTPIDYDVYGSGPAVILIGGTTQHRAIDRRTTEIAQRLGGEGFAAVDYDRRGRGGSGDTAPWSLDREVEDVDALIEATGGSAALYTSSSGAAVALAAVTSGIAVSALALYEPPYFAGSDGREHIATLQRMLDELVDRFRVVVFPVVTGATGQAATRRWAFDSASATASAASGSQQKLPVVLRASSAAHPGDVAGRVARQEHDRAGELLRCPIPAQRHGQRHPPQGVVH